MSDLQSKTPITDSKSVIFNAGTEDQPEPFEVVEASDMRALELAANGLADELKWRMDQLDVVCGGEPCTSEALAAFAALQPSPHGAPNQSK